MPPGLGSRPTFSRSHPRSSRYISFAIQWRLMPLSAQAAEELTRPTRPPPLRAAARRDRPPAAGELDRHRSAGVDVQVDAAAHVGPPDVDRDGGDVPRGEVDAPRARDARHGAPRPELAGEDERRGEVAAGERARAELRVRRDRVARAEPV